MASPSLTCLPPVIEALKAGEITLGIASAFTVANDEALEKMRHGGAFVYVDQEGQLRFHGVHIRPEDAPAAIEPVS